jgi:hypothetical protein
MQGDSGPDRSLRNSPSSIEVRSVKQFRGKTIGSVAANTRRWIYHTGHA